MSLIEQTVLSERVPAVERHLTRVQSNLPPTSAQFLPSLAAFDSTSERRLATAKPSNA